MEKSTKYIFLRWICVCMCIGFFVIHPSPSYSFSDQVIKYGSKGADVKELQGRLSHIGYYNGEIDGDFGWGTYRSVRTFQWKFGMPVDGVAGPKTKLRVWEATKNWRPSAPQPRNEWVGNTSQFSQEELQLMSRAVHGEARGEPYIGKVAVVSVILNRIQNPLFPKTVSGVIFQPGAFTCVADGQIWLAPDAESAKAVRDAINGWDPSGEAIYYFNPATATSKWIWSRPQIKRIGKHIFTK